MIQAPTDQDVAALAHAERARRELCRRHLLPLTQRLGPPDYLVGWFHRLLCNRLEEFEEACFRQLSPRLMVFAPPRHGKSEIISRSFPAWVVGRHPRWEVITSAYGQELADDFGRWCKHALTSPRYRVVFPGTVPREDSTAVSRIDITAGGGLRFVGVGGPIVGRGAHVGIIDDPIKNREAAESETERLKLRNWYTGPFRSRLAPGGGVLLMHQRWHQEDLAGWLQQQDGNRFDVLSFPAIAEADEQFRKLGEALFPERWSLDQLELFRKESTPQDWLSMYQQRPAAADGFYFKVGMINRLSGTAVPKLLRLYQAWDIALTPEEVGRGDQSAGACMGIDHLGRYWLVDMVAGRWSPDELARQMVAFWRKHNAKMVWMENGPPFLGVQPSLIAEMRKSGIWIPYDAITHGGKAKDVRAIAIRGIINGGNLYVAADSDWYPALAEELAAFPNGKRDNRVDAIAYLGLKSQTMLKDEDRRQLPTLPPAAERSAMVKRSYADLVAQQKGRGKAKGRDDWD